jgi:hypothetical protein
MQTQTKAYIDNAFLLMSLTNNAFGTLHAESSD